LPSTALAELGIPAGCVARRPLLFSSIFRFFRVGRAGHTVAAGGAARRNK